MKMINKLPSLVLRRRYLSAGVFPQLRFKYGEVLSILMILFCTSNLMILAIAALDIGVHVRVGGVADREVELVCGIQIISVIYIIAQVVSVLVQLVYRCVPALTRNNTFVLSLAVAEKESSTLTVYGSTATSEESIDCDQLCIFYQRVTGGGCYAFCEPLTLPLTAINLPIQVVCLLLSLLLLVAHSALLDMDAYYTSLTVVTVFNAIQQMVITCFAYILATDTGFCCVGVSITRWFLHTDVYTQTLERLVKQSFSSPPEYEGDEWYKSTLVDPTKVDPTNRADQMKLLQSHLENWHEQLYREVFVGQDVVSLFVTSCEKDRLEEFYTRRVMIQDKEENVIFQRK